MYASTYILDMDTAAIIASIATPLPCNAMPDPALVRTDTAMGPTGLRQSPELRPEAGIVLLHRQHCLCWQI